MSLSAPEQEDVSTMPLHAWSSDHGGKSMGATLKHCREWRRGERGIAVRHCDEFERVRGVGGAFVNVVSESGL